MYRSTGYANMLLLVLNTNTFCLNKDASAREPKNQHRALLYVIINSKFLAKKVINSSASPSVKRNHRTQVIAGHPTDALPPPYNKLATCKLLCPSSLCGSHSDMTPSMRRQRKKADQRVEANKKRGDRRANAVGLFREGKATSIR